MNDENVDNGALRRDGAAANATTAASEPAMPQARALRGVKLALSALALVLGLTTIVVTVAAGGGATARGILFGAILAAMGSLRLYLTLRHDV